MDRELQLLGDCSTPENEFWYHVSAQEELPLAEPKPRTRIEEKINELGQNYRDGGLSFVDLLSATLLNSPETLLELRSLISISDKRLYLDLSYIFSRTINADTGGTLCGCAPHELTRHQTSFFISTLKRNNATSHQAANVIAQYLTNKGLEEILRTYCDLDQQQRTAINECLIAPRENQQIEAKLRGHGPEAELAKLLKFLNCAILPANKATRPMGQHDPNIDRQNFTIAPRDTESTFSSDIVILDRNSNPSIFIVGLVHSSDPGQFGVDKANTVAAIRWSMDRRSNSNRDARVLQLWGLVDGVGYSENKNGTINAMLPHFHEFLQLKSLWKAALRLHTLELARIDAISFDDNFYSANTRSNVSKYVPPDVPIISRSDAQELAQNITFFEAGKAWIFARQPDQSS